MADDPEGRDRKQQRWVAAHLLALYAVVALELYWFPALAGALREAFGAPGSGVGPEYLVVLAIRLIPGALLFVVAATAAIFIVSRRSPSRLSAAFLGLWIAHFVLLACAISIYG